MARRKTRAASGTTADKFVGQECRYDDACTDPVMGVAHIDDSLVFVCLFHYDEARADGWSAERLAK